MENNKIRIYFLRYDMIQIIKTDKARYNIYIDGKLKKFSDFSFYTELEFDDVVLNAKSIVLKKK